MSHLRVFRYGMLVGVRDFTWYYSWRTWFGGWMVQIVAQAVFFSLFARLFDSPEQERFMLIGNAVAVGALTASWTIGQAGRDRGDGTYPLLVIAPSSLVPAVMGRTSIWLAAGVATTLGTFLVLGALFDLALPWPDTLLIVPLVALTCASTYCLSLFLGALVSARLPRGSNLVMGILTTVGRAFCGVSVPVAFWPDAVQILVQLVPITHGLQAIRLVLDEASVGSILEAAGLGTLVGLGWVVIAALVMDRMANSGRADGSIEFV